MHPANVKPPSTWLIFLRMNYQSAIIERYFRHHSAGHANGFRVVLIKETTFDKS